MQSEVAKTLAFSHTAMCLQLCSNDRSPAFMKKAFSLFEFDNEDIKNFSLVQFLPDDKGESCYSKNL